MKVIFTIYKTIVIVQIIDQIKYKNEVCLA